MAKELNNGHIGYATPPMEERRRRRRRIKDGQYKATLLFLIMPSVQVVWGMFNARSLKVE